jgi:hypothetical protein
MLTPLDSFSAPSNTDDVVACPLQLNVQQRALMLVIFDHQYSLLHTSRLTCFESPDGSRTPECESNKTRPLMTSLLRLLNCQTARPRRLEER